MKAPARMRDTPGPIEEAPARKRTIVLVDPDPYLAFLIRLHVPEAVVVEAQPGTTAPGLVMLEPDLVVASVEATPNPIPDLLAMQDPPRVIAVVDAARAARGMLPPGLAGMLTRPFTPSEVNRGVRGALGLGRRSAGPAPLAPLYQRVHAWLTPARIAAVAIAAVIEVTGDRVAPERGIILAIAFLYTTIRWFLRRPSVVVDAFDVAVACALLAATGGIDSSYLPLAIVTAAGTGLARGPAWGLLSGVVIVLGSAPTIVWGRGYNLQEVIPWMILLPLSGLTGGFASRVLRLPADDGFGLLVEANRVLSSLYRIARTLPGGLEIGSVADATLQEIREAMRASAAAMLLHEAGSFVVVGSYGLRDPGGPIVQDQRTGIGAAIQRSVPVVKQEDLHPATVAALGDHACWLTAQIKRDGLPMGLLLAACPDEHRHEANLLLLQRLAEETSVAVENARLFSQVREISIDEERRRLARELHDGVAQALTHLRYELDFMARHSVGASDQLKREVQRLTRVADRASSDVRSMILGLRSAVSAEGLAGSLRSYLRDLRSLGGPDITFDARGEARVRSDIEAEIFRIAQEAVSNSLRHAGATTIKVTLSLGVTKLLLAVEDDGVGANSKRGQERGGGVGLQAMQERASLIGALLDVGPGQQGGWRVVLEYEVEEKG